MGGFSLGFFLAVLIGYNRKKFKFFIERVMLEIILFAYLTFEREREAIMGKKLKTAILVL